MGKCINHPDIDTSYLCMKHNIYLCRECLECRDPDIYCKFRPSCPIYFITRKGFSESGRQQAGKTIPSAESAKIEDPTNKLRSACCKTRIHHSSSEQGVHNVESSW